MSKVAPLRIEVSRLDDLISIVSSMRVSVINLDEKQKIAFAFLAPIASLTPIIYYCKLEEVPQGKYAHFNRITGRIRFSNELSAEPNEVSILLAKVRSQDIFP